jgi:hypothetical protein
MSPWTALLQSLHSALIDEVTDRHPEPKPELGLPKKLTSFQFPSDQATKVFWVKTRFTDSSGVVLIAFQEKFFETLGLNAAEFWELLSKRATAEFTRRQITPIFEIRGELSRSNETPAEFAQLSKLVWIPFFLSAHECWLGLGI